MISQFGLVNSGEMLVMRFWLPLTGTTIFLKRERNVVKRTRIT